MIMRSDHNDNFTIIANSTIRNSGLSDSAFRLLMFMLSCSDEWQFCVKGLASSLGWSERKVMRLIPELKKAGFLEQKLQMDSKGKFLPSKWVVYEVSTAIRKMCIADEPQYTKTAMRLNRNADKPQCVKCVPIINTKYKEEQNIKEDQYTKKYKHALGKFENVFLTNEEQKELCEVFGLETAVQYIERLSEYLNTHPSKNYPNHKTTIEKWIKEDNRKAN